MLECVIPPRTGSDAGRRLDAVMNDPVELVLAYVEAAQRARASGGQDDFEAIRGYLADEVEIRLASPWTNEPWRTAHTRADAVVDRLRSGANRRAPDDRDRQRRSGRRRRVDRAGIPLHSGPAPTETLG